MTTILVPVGGGASDEVVFETALTVARPLRAHLDFYHVKIGAGEAAINTPHADFALGSGLQNTLDTLQSRSDARAGAARHNVETFCTRNGIPIVSDLAGSEGLTASWQDDAGRSLDLLMRRTRYSDLAVMGRHTVPNGLAPDTVELLLLRGGRPILIAPSLVRASLTKTVMICWKECAEATRAVAAALPLLKQADCVIAVSVTENGEAARETGDLVHYLARHRIAAQVRCIDAAGTSTQQILLAAAHECGADLVVMGGYGHRRLREVIFGGCTQTFIWKATGPAVFLMH